MAPLVQIKLHLSSTTRKEVSACLRQAYASGQVRVIRRIQALLHLAAGQTVMEVAALLGLGEQTVRDSLAALLSEGWRAWATGAPRGVPGS